jgi:tripartite-type tricarboxylate transporter receptor subunit TctC
VLAEAGVKRLFVAQGNMPLASESPEELGRFLRDDFVRVAKVMKIAGIKPE